MKKTSWGLIYAILLFLLMCGLAYLFESIILIYIASFIPVIIVLLLPNKRTSQWILPGEGKKRAIIYQVQGKVPSDSDLLVIAFDHRYINWNKSVLYFPTHRIPAVMKLPQDPNAVSLSVLKHDMFPHPAKRGYVGIEVSHLLQRLEYLPYSPDEVNRLVIRLSDLHSISGRRRASRTAVQKKKGLPQLDNSM